MLNRGTDRQTLVPQPLSRTTSVSQYQNATILWILLELRMTEVSAGNWSCKTCKAPVKSSPSTTNQQPTFYRPDALPFAQPTVSEHRKEARTKKTSKKIKRQELYINNTDNN